MDRTTQRQDILRVLDFTERLLEFLLGLVPPPQQTEYRSVWQNSVKPKLAGVRAEVGQLTSASPQLSRADDVGWDPESAHLKAEAIREQAGKGALVTTIRLTNSALGSLKIVFLGLEPPKEFKDFLETWAEGRKEPEPYIMTIFGSGPIPATGNPPTPKPNQQNAVLKQKQGRKFR
jgi:hypothetical protein